MSTDTIEETDAKTEDFSIPARLKCNTCSWTKPNGDPSPCPEGHTTGFTRADDGDVEADENLRDDPEIDAAETVEETADPDDPALRAAIELKMKELFAERSEGKRLEGAEYKASEEHKKAKKAREAQDERIKECIDELDSLYRNEPDPKNFPLFDKAKAEINGMFPAPGAIQPLPPDTFAEALRRKQRDTTLLSMGFKASTLKVLTEKHGLKTALDLVNRVSEYGRRNMDLTKMEGITENRFNEIAEKLEELTGECQAAWEAAHPDEEIPAVEDGEDGDQGDTDDE